VELPWPGIWTVGNGVAEGVLSEAFGSGFLKSVTYTPYPAHIKTAVITTVFRVFIFVLLDESIYC
jgi:hypothetical protein